MPTFRFLHTAAHARDTVPELSADGQSILRQLKWSDDCVEALQAQGALPLARAEP